MTFWILLNAGLSILTASMLAIKLACYADDATFPERIGIAFVASALILNIGPIIATGGSVFGIGSDTPFDEWGSTLLRFGLLIYFGARISQHRHANWIMAQRYLRQVKGKDQAK